MHSTAHTTPEQHKNRQLKEEFYRSWKPNKETRAALRSFQRPSGSRSLLAIATQWATIAGAIIASELVGHWAITAIAIVLIAGRQHALGILAHEGVHRRLCRNKRLNDLVSDFACAFPIAITSKGYGYEHLKHHRHPNSHQDPYWEMFEQDEDVWTWPKSRLAAARVFLFDVLGFNAHRNIKMILRWGIVRSLLGRPMPSGAEIVSFIAFWLAVTLAVIMLGVAWEFVLYWLIPSAGPLMLFIRLRVSAEHLMPGDVSPTDTNNVNHVDGSWIERLLISPLNIQYHIVHHLFPGVPWHNLPNVHRVLMRDASFRRWSRRYPSYLGPGGIYLTTLTRPAGLKTPDMARPSFSNPG